MRSSKIVFGLLATTAVATLTAGGTALAQPAAAGETAIDEVVVTANRRSDTVHNIPLSVSAVTPQQFEAQGLKTAQDIARVVPALRVGSSNGGNGGNSVPITVRGIAAGNGQAATSGVYVDDVSITQRNTTNPLAGGTVLPQLFDLERVEVLRGPQGTLYGGSSMGGAIRFITPQPSFTRFSARIMGEVSTTREGGQGYDSGLSVGGPIVQDKLAFRASGSFRKDAGYVDHVSRFTGAVIAEDTNTANHTTYHLSLAWRPVEQATVTLSYLFSQSKYDDVDSYWEDIPQYTTNGTPGLTTGAGQPNRTFGPYNMFGPYKSGANTAIGDNFYTSDAQLRPLLNANSHRMSLPSLTFDYAFDKMNFKAIVALNTSINTAAPSFAYQDIESQGRLAPFVPTLPIYNSIMTQGAEARSLTGEARFSSNDPDSRLSWVAGAYYNLTRMKSIAFITSNFGDLLRVSSGAPAPPSFNGVVANFPQNINELQIAAFGEATVSITEKLKATAGLRITRDELDIEAFQGGALFFPATPNVLNRTVVLNTTESPITPKVGLQYVIDSNNNVYVNAAKGFRSGGANTDLRGSATCATSIAERFPGGFPLGWPSDSLWSYEGGAKSRFFGGRAAVNASVFYIDWKNVPTNTTLTCGQPVVIPGAHLISKGFDVDSTFRLFPGFTAQLAAGYTDIEYRGTVLSGGPGTLPQWFDGDQLPGTPKWSVSLSGQYDFELVGNRAYIRADYQYTGPLLLSGAPGTTAYQPDNFSLPSSDIVSARTGININNFDISLFVNNLFNSQDLLNRGSIGQGGPGRVTCRNADCSSFARFAIGATNTTFRPRTFGVTASYRY